MEPLTPRVEARALTSMVQSRSHLLKAETELALAISIYEELGQTPGVELEELRAAMASIEQARRALVRKDAGPLEERTAS